MCNLITGGGGFVGCHLIRLLNKIYPDRQIIVIDQHIPNYQFDDALKAEYILGDTVDIVDIMRNYPRPDIVFHLGEFSRIRPSFSMIKDVWHSNCAGTFQVIQFCSQHQIKLIYTGSSSKFSDKNNENMSPYAWFKAKNIELIKNYSQWFGLELAWQPQQQLDTYIADFIVRADTQRRNERYAI